MLRQLLALVAQIARLSAASALAVEPSAVGAIDGRVTPVIHFVLG